MADIPVRPPPPAPPLPPGWVEHQAPSGHSYYFNAESRKSTYVRPVLEAAIHQPSTHTPQPYASLGVSSSHSNYNVPAPQNAPDPKKQMEDLMFGGRALAQQYAQIRRQENARGGFRGGFRGGHSNFPDRKRQQEDRPKHRNDLPNCAPWVLVKTKLGRRFVWNKNTNESFWRFPSNVMKAVVEFDRKERDKKERKERGEPSDNEDDTAMAEMEAELAAAEEEIQQEIVEVDGEEGMEDEEEYEEVEVTDDEGEDAQHPQKRLKTEGQAADQEMGDDDLAWQLAQMEEMEGDFDDEYKDEEPPLSEEDCKALFKELLDDTNTNPFTPWDKVLESGTLYDDERYKALPNMNARKECFNEWAKEKAQFLKEQKAKQQKLDPRIPYLALLDRFATPKLYWPEFKRKYRKEAEMKDIKLSEKDKEKLYRDHVKRLAMRSSDLKAGLTSLLRSQPLSTLNRSSTLSSLPSAIETDIRYISLAPSTREVLIETYISTLPRAPEGGTASVEEDAEAAKKREERRRREKALAERERRVREEKRKQERELAYGKGRLKEEEMELERAMKVGKDGLRAQLEGS